VGFEGGVAMGGDGAMRVGYLGPEGTFTHEAALEAPGAAEFDLLPLPTIYDTVMAVHEGFVERAVVPIENSIEGSVNATLDALAMETGDVAIVGEVVHPIAQCLIARKPIELHEIDVIVSHPQASGQCARFIRTRLPRARVMTASSTADAVRMVAERGPGASPDDAERWAALGNRLAAERYGCQVLRAGVEDLAGNETRFVWLARGAGGPGAPAVPADASGASAEGPGIPGAREPMGPWKTAIVFWGVGAEAPGWLVACLSEFASRGVNLTRIESRPRRQGLGRYMFFADLEGRDREPHVAEAITSLRAHVEQLRVLGSYPAA
jgi:prephenate dehydratase